MSLSDASVRSAISGRRKSSARRGAATSAVAVCAIGLILVGCGDGAGFRPMYAAVNGGPALEAKLASVEIGTIPGRVGQRVRNQIAFQSTGGGLPAPPLYRLDIVIAESIQATLVKTTGEAASSVYVLDARFTLVDIKSKKVLLQGSSFARAAFDRFPSIYSNVRAREDAEARAAGVIAEDVKSRIATFLSRDRV